MRTGRSSALVLAFALGLPAVSQAQERQGFLIGFSVGWWTGSGATGSWPGESLDDAVAAAVAGGELHIGGAPSRRVALLGEMGVGYLAGCAQVWPVRDGRLWLKVGAGGWTALVDRGGGPVILSVGGVEIVRRGRFTMDIQLREMAFSMARDWSRYTVVGLGFNWY